MKPINMKKAVSLCTHLDALREQLAYYKREPRWYENAIKETTMLYDSVKAELDSALLPLSTELNAVQNRCSVRTVTAKEVTEFLAWLSDEHLNIPKKAMEGITVRADLNAQKFPSAYKYTPESTHFIATYKSGAWRITNVYRGVCNTHKADLTLTDEAKTAVLDRTCTIWNH